MHKTSPQTNGSVGFWLRPNLVDPFTTWLKFSLIKISRLKSPITTFGLGPEKNSRAEAANFEVSVEPKDLERTSKVTDTKPE